jgi:ribosomal protein S17E
MTPQEKAKELVDKYYNVGDQEFDYSKEFALIAVEEILKQFNKIKVSHIITGYITYKDFEENLTSIQDQLDSEMILKWNYWNKVKHEIEKL